MLSTVLIPGLNPACASIKMKYFSAHSDSLLFIVRENSFPRVLKSVIPLKFSTSLMLPFYVRVLCTLQTILQESDPFQKVY